MSIYYRFLLEMTQKESELVNHFMVMKLHKFLDEIGTDGDEAVIRGILDKLEGSSTPAPQEAPKPVPQAPEHKKAEPESEAKKIIDFDAGIFNFKGEDQNKLGGELMKYFNDNKIPAVCQKSSPYHVILTPKGKLQSGTNSENKGYYYYPTDTGADYKQYVVWAKNDPTDYIYNPIFAEQHGLPILHVDCINLSAKGTFSHFLLEYEHGVDRGDFLLVVSVEGKPSVFGLTPTYIELDRPTEENIPMTASAFKIDNPVLNKVLQDVFTGRQDLAYKEDPRLKDRKTAHKQYEKPQEPKKRGDSGIYADFMKQVQDTKQKGGQWQPSTASTPTRAPTQEESVSFYRNIIKNA